MKILLVDDSRSQRMIQKMVLKQNGLSESDIHEAAEGNEALEKSTKNGYQLIFCDWHMPEMSGVEFVRKARAEGVSVPIVMCTSEGEKNKIQEAIDAGAVDFITKPIDDKKFWTMAQKYL